MNEIFFMVEDAEDGGYVARSLGVSIVTEADSEKELMDRVRDAVRRHFEEGRAPKVIRLHYTREQVIAA
jgi:hypothetical protein